MTCGGKPACDGADTEDYKKCASMVKEATGLDEEIDTLDKALSKPALEEKCKFYESCDMIAILNNLLTMPAGKSSIEAFQRTREILERDYCNDNMFSCTHNYTRRTIAGSGPSGLE